MQKENEGLETIANQPSQKYQFNFSESFEVEEGALDVEGKYRTAEIIFWPHNNDGKYLKSDIERMKLHHHPTHGCRATASGLAEWVEPGDTEEKHFKETEHLAKESEIEPAHILKYRHLFEGKNKAVDKLLKMYDNGTYNLGFPEDPD